MQFQYAGRPAKNGAEVAVTILALLLCLALSPLLVVLHFALRALGRKGFTRKTPITPIGLVRNSEPQYTTSIKVDLEGFEAA
jgi:hypothetical protein